MYLALPQLSRNERKTGSSPEGSQRASTGTRDRKMEHNSELCEPMRQGDKWKSQSLCWGN